MKIHIPEESRDNHIAFLGGTGSGKTSAAKSNIVEPALTNKERVIIIDPTSAWWGLRMKANGTKGFPIYIFGGQHGDYPLNPYHGELLAEAFAHSSDSVIFDLKGMTVSDRTMFFTKFAETILRKNRGPVNLVIDEAHLFMPQAGAKSGGLAPAMLHAGNNLTSLGRSSGFRISLLSQRPAKLHKDSLSQVQTMVAMRMISPQDRKAIREWVDDQADPEQGKEVISSLPTLKPGQGWVWAPISNILERVHFSMPVTFDSSKAPTMEEGTGPVLAPINLDALKDKLGSIEEEVKANDPKLLKAEVARIKVELSTRPSGNTADQNLAIYDSAFDDGQKAGFSSGFAKGHSEGWGYATRAIQANIASLPEPEVKDFKMTTPDYIKHGLEMIEKTRVALGHKKIASIPETRRCVNESPAGATTATLTTTKNYGGGLQRILTALAQAGKPLKRKQVALRAGMAQSGTFANYLSTLRKDGMLIQYPEGIMVTPSGKAMAVNLPPLPTGKELLDYWINFVGSESGAARILRVMADGTCFKRAELAAAAGMAESGTFANYLSKLNILDLIIRDCRGISIREELI